MFSEPPSYGKENKNCELMINIYFKTFATRRLYFEEKTRYSGLSGREDISWIQASLCLQYYRVGGLNQLIKQSINQSINQSVIQSVDTIELNN